MLDLYDWGGYCGTVAVGALQLNPLYVYEDFGYTWDQGSVFQAQYRNGDVLSPMSNELPAYYGTP